LRAGRSLKEAIKQFESAIEQDPQQAAAHYYLIQILLNAPAIAGGDKQRAIELNDHLKELSALYHQVVNSQLALMNGEDETAEQLLLESHHSSPQNTLLNYSLLSFYHDHDQCKAAINFGQNFLSAPKEWDEINPAHAHLLIAECQQHLGNRQQSLQHYALALGYDKSEKTVRQVQAAV